MSAGLIERLSAQLDGPRDGALLRYSLATALAAIGESRAASVRCREALQFDPHYSAAWKLLGRVLAESGDTAAAMQAYADGISAASARGDRQAEKEMKVFLARLQRAAT